MDKNKRNWIIAIVVVFILVFGGGYLMTRNNDTEQNNNNGGTVKGQNNVKIVANAASQLTLEDYSTAEFSMKKPQGWKVETQVEQECIMQLKYMIQTKQTIKYF